jgi:hypothetical protein
MVVWLRARYDRVLALAVFAALLGSLLFLALRIGRLQRDEAAFQRRIDGLRPTHPHAVILDAAPFERAAEMVRNPPQIADWTNALTAPEIRVWCVDCSRPIPFPAETCPFCSAAQPPTEDWGRDSDGDGIPDLAEQELKLDPLNPADAREDADGDLFSNVDEYREKTDLRDPADYPAIEKFLHIEKVDAVPFSLLFKSYMKGAKGYTFQINTRKGGRTHFSKLGEEVDGFKLAHFTLNVTTGATAVAGGREDRSELTLNKSGRSITLAVGRDQQYDEYTCHLRFRLTDQAIACKVGERFDLRPGRSYEAMRVDTAADTVVIRRVADGREFHVTKAGVPGAAAAVQPQRSSVALPSGDVQPEAGGVGN